MALRSLALLLAAPAAQAALSTTPFPNGIFGTWSTTPGTTPQAILGPLAWNFIDGKQGAFSALRDDTTSDVWFTLLTGQVWHVSGDQVQYCFGQGKTLNEQSPFDVHSVGDDNITICWRKGLRGMPTQSKGCSGCDCAKIEIKLTAADALSFTFWMSPPVIHARMTFVRTGAAPALKNIAGPADYTQCDFRDHYGPNTVPQPDLKNATFSPQTEMTEADVRLEQVVSGLAPGCAAGVLQRVKENPEVRRVLLERSAEIEAPRAGGKKCDQLNGFNHLLNTASFGKHKSKIPDVRLQYTLPTLPCDPCDVHYSISADIEEDEYIALGFKGQSWEANFPNPPEVQRHCYFGMCIDSWDNFTTDRIALGYASPSHGSCVREVAMNGVLTGKPSDVAYPIMRDTSVERAGKRTVVRWTLSQRWPSDYAKNSDGPFRVMWAIGAVTEGSGKDCKADFGYHGATDKGLGPTNWLSINSVPCTFSASEYGS